MKLKAIYSGWKNYIFPNPEMEQKAKARAKICSKCPFAKQGTYQRLMKDYSLKEIKGLLCEKCGCPLSTLLRQDEKTCNKWSE